ncbi:MAG: hypothetical protein QOE76_383 [Frankiales bacterium]|nr:hypothetical protein [Frankiales bacterium]MDX6242660.1 hypothetical protein [Frankiales bacterium]
MSFRTAVSARRHVDDSLLVNKWAELRLPASARAEKAPDPWDDPDRAVLDHMREILGVSLFHGCGQPDCFDCAED